jgi:hypothetical protein
VEQLEKGGELIDGSLMEEIFEYEQLVVELLKE